MLSPFKLIDLTHTLSPFVPSWGGDCGFQQEIQIDYEDCAGKAKFRVQSIRMQSGIGTHMDAPAHCIPGGLSIADLDIQQFFAPCVVIDVSEKSHERYEMSVEDILAFEKEHGPLSKGCFVIVRTGWEKFWSDPEKYRNQGVFPTISETAACFLLQREIVGLGIDTLSADRPGSEYPVHRSVLGAGKYLVENVANAEVLPPAGCYTLVLPIKIREGTEAPVRLIALLSQQGKNA